MLDRKENIMFLIYKELRMMVLVLCLGLGTLFIVLSEMVPSSSAGKFGVLFVLWALVSALINIVIHKRLKAEYEI